MSRTLDFPQLLTAIVVIAVLMAICLINMYILAQNKKSVFTFFVHLLSLFAASGLIFQMMSVVVFVLPLSVIYHQLSQISFAGVGLGFLIGAAILMIGRKKYHYNSLLHKRRSALSGIEGIVFVIDRDGFVTNINHQSKYQALFGDIDSIKSLIQFIKEKCEACLTDGENLDALDHSMSCEIVFKHPRSYFSFRLAPIVRRGIHIGCTAVFEDITAIRLSEITLREQNDFLNQANDKLSNFVRVAGALEAENERLQIIEHVQTTLIQELESALSAILQIKEQSFADGTYQAKAKDLAAQLRQIYHKVRVAVSRIAGKEA